MTSTRKKYQWEVDNKMRGAFAEVDFEKKVVRVNKKRHKSKSAGRISKNPDGSEKLIDTLVHENEHILDPLATEKQVKKRAKRKVEKMSKKQKAKFYSKVK